MEKYVEQSQLIDDIKNEEYVANYESMLGKNCFRVFATLKWYIMKCKEYNLKPQRLTDFYYTARGNGFDFDWVEEDCILAID